MKRVLSFLFFSDTWLKETTNQKLETANFSLTWNLKDRSCGPSVATWFLFHFRPYKKICCFPGELKDWKSHFAKDKRVQCNNSKKKKTHFTWKTHKMTRKSWCGGPGQTKYFAKTIKGEILVILTNIGLNEVMYTKETLDVHTKKGLTVYSAKDFFSPDL